MSWATATWATGPTATITATSRKGCSPLTCAGAATRPRRSAAFYKLRTEADNPNRSLYDNNKAVYGLLRYGVPVRIEAGKVTETVKLINWEQAEQNDFAIAEEVTLRGNYERRPDLVLYVNGIAVGVIELKNSRVSLGDGIRQNISNQSKEFNAWFFSTVQFIFRGQRFRGAAIRYGAHGGEVFPQMEGRRAGRQPLQAGQVSAQDVRQRSADRADARLRALRRRDQESAAGASVFRDQGRASTR
ncbi:MAG: type I restriction endonuclease [Methanothrix soehngenii]